jgi:hypothetical protein
LIEEKAKPAEILERIQRGRRNLDSVPAALHAASTRQLVRIEPAPNAVRNARRTVKVSELAELLVSVTVPPDAQGTGTTALIKARDIQADLSVVPGSTVDLDRLPAVELTQPGDIVVQADGHVRAGVDPAGGAVVAAPLRILRPTSGAITPLTLAALITHLSRRQGVGTVQMHLELRELEIPLPTAEMARGFEESLAEVFEKRRLLAEAVKDADEMAEALVIGFGAGIIQFGHDVTTAEQP